MPAAFVRAGGLVGLASPPRPRFVSCCQRNVARKAFRSLPRPHLSGGLLWRRPSLKSAATMNVLEAIQARQSIRAYQPRDIESAKLETILQAANQAASAANLQ